MISRCGWTCTIGMLVGVSVAFGDEQRGPEKPAADLAKMAVIELPTTRLLAESSAAALGHSHQAINVDDVQAEPALADDSKADDSKHDIELPAKKVLIGASRSPRKRTTGPPENPKVAPGKVTWHPDFASARAASLKSGKPVLHFQLLGHLDDQFC